MEKCNLIFTGASGFLGTNVKPLLSTQYNIKTLGLTNGEDIKLNLSNEVPLFTERFDLILHAAGKAHSVPKTNKEKKIFFDVNFQGTKNLCKGLEKIGVPKSFIFISTVAVYGLDFGEEIAEDYPLKGTTPYALSKIKAEQFLMDWCQTNGVLLGIIRPSLIAGPNPPGNLGAMIQGIKTGKYFSISDGKAQKSVLMAQDIATLLPLLAAKGGVYNVCDNEHPTVRNLENLIALQLGKSIPFSIPIGFAKLLAYMGDFFESRAPINSLKLAKLTKSLTFSNYKARRDLNWEPSNVLENFRIK